MTFSYVDDAFQVLWTTRKSLELLERIQRIMAEAEKKDLSPEQVREQIDENAPELSDLKSVLPKTRVELYLLLGVLIAMIKTCQNNENLTQSDMDQMIDSAKTEINRKLDLKQETQAPKAKARPKNPDGTTLGRNDPCFCGSGIKYKDCHYREF